MNVANYYLIRRGFAEHASARGANAADAGKDTVGPERCFQSALGLARRQHSLTLELRAAVSLCRALAVGGRASEGQGLVSAVLARIAGGQAARDVQEARAVLELVS